MDTNRENDSNYIPPELPLTQPRPETTRFNRKVVITIIAIVGGFTAISLIWALSPQKKQSPEQIAAEQKKKAESSPNVSTAPIMSEMVNSTPGTYSNLHSQRQLNNGTPQLGPPLTGDLGEAQLRQQQAINNGEPYYSTYPVSGGTAGGTPGQPSLEQQVYIQERSQKHKEALDSRRSSLTFGNEFSGKEPGNSPGAGGGPGGAMSAPQMPDLNSLAAAMGGGGGPQQTDQNMQDEKRGFSQAKRSGGYLEAGLHKAISPFEVKAGSIFPGTLITGVNSDLPGQMVGQIRENIYDTVSGRYLLIPQGTRIIGEYDSKISYGQERALIVWTRLIFPNGDSINLEGMPGVDLRGYAGLTGKVNNHYVRLLTGVVLGSVLGAASQIAVGPAGVQNPNFEQLAVAGAAQNINDAGQQITRKNLNMQPTIEIHPGQKFNVFVTKDLILRPYRI